MNNLYIKQNKKNDISNYEQNKVDNISNNEKNKVDNISNNEKNKVDNISNNEKNENCIEINNDNDEQNIITTKTKKKKTTKQKIKLFLKRIFQGLGVIIILYILLNVGCNIYEKIQLKSINYGTKLNVKDHKMNVKIDGEKNNSTIVFLTGFGSPAPIIQYKPLADTLSDKYKFVTIEPFGYGLSDSIDEERSVENIVEELRTGIKSLGIEKFYLMTHSIGGLYSLYWSNKYPDEVLGFIGLDATVPHTEEANKSVSTLIHTLAFFDYLGLERMMSLFNDKNLILHLIPMDSFTDEEIKMFKIITLQKGFNKIQRREISKLFDNYKTVNDMKFPKTIPVINFVCSKSVEQYSYWKQTHIDVGSESISSEFIEIPGYHAKFLFEERYTIANKIKSWIVE